MRPEADGVDAAIARAERDRITEVYAGYDSDPGYRSRWLVRPGAWLNERDRWRDAADVLAQAGRSTLAGDLILEVGVGIGANVSPLVALGAAPERIVGVDLVPARLAEVPATGAWPVNGDGTALPVRSRSADLVVLSTVLSSILDPAVARAVAAEAVRVLRPSGIVLWYDLRMRNPRNPHVRGIGLDELRALFPGFTVHQCTSTVLPPLARRLPGRLRGAWPALRAVPTLRSHRTAALVRETA